MSSLSLPKYLSRSSFNVRPSSSSVSISKAKFIWRFPPPKFSNLPSCVPKRYLTSETQPVTVDEELVKRQDLAVLIYDIGLHLNVSFTCIYSGVVYMHRFFMLHTFQHCESKLVAAACLFLSCKVNEMPRPLSEFSQHLLRITNQLNDISENVLSVSSPKATMEQLPAEILSNYNQQITDYENMLLSTLGFCLNVEQPYMIITRNSQIMSVPKEIIQKAYDIATKSTFFTLFSMKYTVNLIACFSLHLALRSSQIPILDNPDGSQWFHLFNEEFTEKLLQEVADEYQLICKEKWSKQSQQRFEQIRHIKVNGQQHKPKSNYELSNAVTFLKQPHDYHKIRGDMIVSTQNAASSSLLLTDQQGQQQQLSHDRFEIAATIASSVTCHSLSHDSSVTDRSSGNRSLITRTVIDLPSETFLSSLSPSHNQNNFSEKNTSISSVGISSTKPIPILMTPVNSNLYHNSARPSYYSHTCTPGFQYPLTSPTRHIFHHSLAVTQAQNLPRSYSSNYLHNTSYYPQYQTPLFYHQAQESSHISNKRYGEPPAPPMKRFRGQNHAYQHY